MQSDEAKWVRRRPCKSEVKSMGLALELRLKVQGLSEVEGGGIRGVAVK